MWESTFPGSHIVFLAWLLVSSATIKKSDMRKQMLFRDPFFLSLCVPLFGKLLGLFIHRILKFHSALWYNPWLPPPAFRQRSQSFQSSIPYPSILKIFLFNIAPKISSCVYSVLFLEILWIRSWFSCPDPILLVLLSYSFRPSTGISLALLSSPSTTL